MGKLKARRNYLKKRRNQTMKMMMSAIVTMVVLATTCHATAEEQPDWREADRLFNLRSDPESTKSYWIREFKARNKAWKRAQRNGAAPEAVDLEHLRKQKDAALKTRNLFNKVKTI